MFLFERPNVLLCEIYFVLLKVYQHGNQFSCMIYFSFIINIYMEKCEIVFTVTLKQ